MTLKKDHSKSVVKASGVELPAFMQDEKITGLEQLKQFVVPPRIKIVQKQSSAELLAVFGVGDVLLAPMNACVVEMPRDDKGRPQLEARTAFKVVPIFFYPEWVTWNPIEMQGKTPAIAYRTVDPTDPIVTKSRHADLRSEPHPDDPTGALRVRHVEHLNFVVALYQSTLGAEAAILSFSRGEHSAGTKFASLIKMRKAAIYGCIFEAVVTHRTGTLGDWFGLDMCSPADNISWVTEEEYAVFKALHREFAEYHKERRLQSPLGNDGVANDPAAAVATDDF